MRTVGAVFGTITEIERDGSVKQKAQFSVAGMSLQCPLCDEMVKSGNSHECEKDGGVSTRRTWPIASKELKLKEPGKAAK